MHGDPDVKVLKKPRDRLSTTLHYRHIKAAQFPLQLCQHVGLEKPLGILNIPFAALHATSNDAYRILSYEFS